jgi:putative endonuclease
MGKTLYILESLRHGRFYVGSTDDLSRRLKEHNAGQTKSTASGKPWIIVFYHNFDSSILGLKAERRIKKLKSRNIILDIIQGKIDIDDLIQ